MNYKNIIYSILFLGGLLLLISQMVGCATSSQVVKVPIAAPCVPIKSSVKKPNPFNQLTEKSTDGEVANAYIQSANLK